MFSQSNRLASIASLATLALLVASCGNQPAPDASSPQAEGGSPAAGGSNVSGQVKVDGSSTVFPISEAMAE
ncbi:MAG: phosphate-binding protein, partial [Coleofasciculus sp. S288]|nr:phosphate-binding protein [Coleofasciculus sp. S288]